MVLEGMEIRSSLKNITLKGRYRVDTVLGQGGFAITYKGWDLREGEPVAIKEYYPNGLAVRDSTLSPEVSCPGDSSLFVENKKRFMREAAVLSQFVNQGQVVHILDCFEDYNTAYIVMEYVDGITLKDHVRRNGGKISWEETREIVKALIEALILLHKHGIIHRDLSPENIMILPDGGLKILDFGAVKQIDGAMEVGRRLTKPTEAIVKQGYAPIEQYQNHGNLGPWTDVYALCATVYYCLTGSVPLDAPARIVTPVTIELIARGVAISEKEEAAIIKGMEILIQDRIQSMEELYDELFVVTAESETERHSEAILPNVRKRKVFVLAALIGLLILAVVIAAGVSIKSGRYVLREGDDLAACLRREGIKEIIIPEGVSCTVAEVTVDKRVTVEDGASLSVGNLIVTESGYVKVEGTLDIGSAVMHLLGAESRVEITDGGELVTNKHTLLWTESADHLNMQVSGEGLTTILGNQLLFDEEEVFRDAASVTTFEELKAALEAGRPVSIDADIEVPETIGVTTAVRVSENVTLTRMDGDVWIVIAEGAVVVNHGTVRSGLNLYGRGYLLNYAHLDMRDMNNASLWMEGGGVLVNKGTLDADNVSRVWADAQMYNVSVLNAHYFLLLGGSMVNTGEIHVFGTPQNRGRAGLTLSNGSVLYNKGSLTAEDDSRVENYGCIENTGRMRMGERVVFRNSILHNEGYFESVHTAKLNEVSGIYYGGGEFYLPGKNGLCLFEVQEESRSADIVQVKTKEELYSALERDDVTQILIQEQIRVTEDLHVKKELFVEGSLIVEEGASVTIRSSRMTLLNGGSLSAAKVSLLDQAQMIMEDGAQLKIVGSGELRLKEQSLLLSRGGEIFLEQAYLAVENTSCLVMMESGMNADGADIHVLKGAVFADAICDERNVRELGITIDSGAEMHLSGNVTLQDADISVKDGSLINSARYLTLGSSTLFVGESGEMYNVFCSTRMNETNVRNEGFMRASGWDENVTTLNHTIMVNTGLIDYSLIEIDENSIIENNGSFYLFTHNDEEREQIQSRLKGNDFLSW